MPSLDISQLSGSLNAPLQRLYLIHGEEELLRLESLDMLRAAAKKQGYLHREIHHAEGAQFDWQAMIAEVGSIGLFADLKWVEIHIPGGKPGKTGSDALQYLAQNIPNETAMVIVLPKLEKAQTQAKWFSELAKHATVIEAKAISNTALPAWIRERLNQQGLNIDSQALVMFAERVEGNLLAAKQEIEKLALIHPPGHLISLADAEQAIANVARFDVFQLSGAWMSGDARRTAKLLEGLESEGQEPVLLIWSLAEDIRTLIRLLAALKQGQSIAGVRNELRLWGDKQHHAAAAAKRLSPTRLINALQTCAQIDRQIKGAEAGDAWRNVRQLVVSLAG